MVQFYKADEANSKRDKGQYEKFAIEHEKMFRIGSVECNEWSSICSAQGITEYPSYIVYPPTPIPAVNYIEPATELDTDKLKKMAYKYVGNRVIEITSSNIDNFVGDNPGKPKMLLFSNKKGTPIVYRALSTYFDKTLEFGLVRSEEEAVVKKYKVSKYPTFMLLRNGEKNLAYDGDSYTYSELFEFVNIYSETFVFGGDQEELVSAAEKPWLNEPFPYLDKESGNDICLKKDGTLCVIYVVGDKSQNDETVLQHFKDVKEKFTSQIARGITFSFIRLDASTEPEFAAMFNLESMPATVIMNPGKRKRFLLHDKDDLGETLDVILGGDARFKAIKGNKLAELVSEHE